MNDTLGWTGLGQCDGGSMGSGTMEVCRLVADVAIAKRVIEEDFKKTKVAGYSRIYDERKDQRSPQNKVVNRKGPQRGL